MKKGKIIALILAAALVTGAFPMYSFADETEDTEVAAEETIEETIEETEPIESEEEDDEDIVYEEVEDVEETEISVETEEPTESTPAESTPTESTPTEPTPTEPTPAETDPSDVYLNPHGTCGENAFWEFNEDTGVLTISGNGPMMNGQYQGSFEYDRYRNQITSVEVEEGITSIGNYAFALNFNMISVELPSTVTTIGEWAFNATPNLVEIDLPSSLTRIGTGAFNSSGLQEIMFPESVGDLGDNAFAGCNNLESVVIPETIRTMGKELFSGCGNLKVVTIKSSSISKLNDTFKNCTSLEEVHFYTNRNEIEFRGGTFDGANESCKIYFHSPEGYIFDTTGSEVTQSDATIPMIATFSEGNTVVTYSSALMHVDTTSTFTIKNKLITLSADLKGYRIKLNDYIGFVFYMDIQDSDGAYVSIDIPGMDTQIQNVTADRKSSDGFYEFTCEVPARQMADDIRVQVHFSDGTLGKAYTVSVRAYCMTIINDQLNRYTEYVPLAKALLNYGSAAQIYFGYNCGSESDLANGKMDYKDREMGIPVVDTNRYRYETTIPADSQINFAGVSLTFGSRSTMRLYFSGVTENEVFCDSPDASKATSADGHYVIVTVPVTKLKDILHGYKVSFYSADSSTYITYRPYNYVVNILNNRANFETPMYDLVRGYYYYIEEIDKLSKLDS